MSQRKLEMSPGFIEQTAHDYDMPVHEVDRIARLFPDEFYEKLEEYIHNRYVYESY